MGCYEQPAITAIRPVMAAPITLSGDNSVTYGRPSENTPANHVAPTNTPILRAYSVHEHVPRIAQEPGETTAYEFQESFRERTNSLLKFLC